MERRGERGGKGLSGSKKRGRRKIKAWGIGYGSSAEGRLWEWLWEQ